MTKTEKYLINGGTDYHYAGILAYVETASRTRVFAPHVTYADQVRETINSMTDADLLASDSIY